jgi:hypothetical protein
MFELQTPNAALPILEDRTVVYYMPFQRASLGALDEAKRTAQALGFQDEPVALSSEIYQWQMRLPSPVVLEQNIANGSYTYNYQWQMDKSLLAQKNIPGQDQTFNLVEQYLERTGVRLEDVSVNNAKISYRKNSGNRMVPAVSISDANFVEVDLYRNPVRIGAGEDLVERAVVTPEPDRGIIRMFFSGANLASKRVIGVEYNYFPVNYLQPETYLLKPIEQAWQELKSGGAFVAVNEDEEADTIFIRRISLAYYDNYEAQKFLQPIYVFKGDDGGSDEFVAYVQAVNDVHVAK